MDKEQDILKIYKISLYETELITVSIMERMFKYSLRLLTFCEYDIIML